MTMDVPLVSEADVNFETNLDDLIPYYIVRKGPEITNSNENISAKDYIENVTESLELISNDINGITENDDVNELEMTKNEEMDDIDNADDACRQSYSGENHIVEIEYYNKPDEAQFDYNDKNNGEYVIISYEDAPRERFKIMTSGLVKCLRCEVFFKTEILFQVHHCSAGFRCTTCYMEFSKYNELIRHEVTHINSNQLHGSKSKDTSYLSGTENNEVVKKCNFCGNTYSKIEELEEHTKWHQLIKCYLCDFCGMEFKEHFRMVLHVAKCPKRHSATQKENKVCSIKTAPKTKAKVNSNKGINGTDLKTRILNGEFKVSVSLTRLTDEQIGGKWKIGKCAPRLSARRRPKNRKLLKSDNEELTLNQKEIFESSQSNETMNDWFNESKKLSNSIESPSKQSTNNHKTPVHVISDIQLCPPKTEQPKLPVESESSRRSEASDSKVYDEYSSTQEQINNEKSFIHSIYICKLCKLRFARRELSHLHVCSSTEEKDRICTICNIAYSNVQVLVEHMSIHEITNYMCFHCNSCCATFENLSTHVRECAQAPDDTADHLLNDCDNLYECEDGFVCRSCKAHFKSKTDYNKHFCVTCNVCSAIFNSLNSFLMHMKRYDIAKESIPPKENVQMASESISTIEEYYLEVQNDDMDSPVLYKNTSEPIYVEYEEIDRSADDTNVRIYYDCSNCQKQFSKVHSLQRHSELYRRKIIRCTECKMKFTLRSDCYNHIKKSHHKSSITKEMVQEEYEPTCDKSKYNIEDKDSVWVCDLCETSARDKKDIFAHVISHDTLIYKCPYCEEKTFPSESIFTSHIKMNHHEITTVLLEQLTNEIVDSFISYRPKNTQLDNDSIAKPEEFASTEHDKIINNGTTNGASDNEDKLNCPQCNKNFLTKKLFVKHMLKHIKVKEFKCNICQDIFNLKVFLKKHTKRHRKCFPHVCPSCCHVFKTKNKLQSHFKQHLDTLNLANNCSLCDCEFDTHKQLVHHQVAVHRMKKSAK